MIVKNNNKGKRGISRASRVMLSILAAGFTLISAWNGFTFYKVLFGMSMAVLITATFEVARITCLFSFIRAGKKIGVLGIVTYIIVAGVCAFAAINSFCYEVILRDQAGRDQYRDQIHRIKQEYSRSVAEKITVVAKEIAHVEKILSSYPKSATWKRRLATAVAKRDRLVADRDKFLDQEPENPEHWIKANSALLGMKLEGKSRESEEMISVTKAIKELWGLEKSAAQKIMGIIITLTVELCIILLSFLTGVVDKPRRADEVAGVDGVAGKPQDVAAVANVAEEPRDVAVKKKKSGSVAKAKVTGKATDDRNEETATPDFDEESLEKFVAEYREHFARTGKLPPLRILSRKQRKVRKVLETFSHEDLEKIFGK
ncbi:MAG: hypothetical protein PVH61_39735 [Candidatus Aminicenantes bacterium]